MPVLQQNPETKSSTFLNPLVQAWLKKMESARIAKKPFQTVADQCEAFFAHATDFMWNKKGAFYKQFIGSNVSAPNFKVTLNKAFEFRAHYGPHLYWKYPERIVKNYDPVKFEPEAFGDPQDPQIMQEFQQAMDAQSASRKKGIVRNSLMEAVLNYTQREQPGGGLAMHSKLAVDEALTTGRGCLWPTYYHYPGSNRTLTGCFFGSTRDLLIDPDCKDPTLTSAKWIARVHRDPYWKVEERWGLKKGSLRGKGQFESAEHRAENSSNNDNNDRAHGGQKDMIEWYEIWSKSGVGNRISIEEEDFVELNGGVAAAFDKVVGDYAYICVTDALEYPLNAHSSKVGNPDASDRDVRKMFDWPTPFYLDDRWPMELLDFHPQAESCWPIAPMSPGLGELLAMNVLMSVVVSNAHAESQRIIAYLKSASNTVKGALEGGDNPAYMELSDSMGESIDNIVKFIQQPAMNIDIWHVIDRLGEYFDKRVGLTEPVYGLNAGGVQTRSAEDSKNKQQNIRVRPDYMADQVEAWQSKAADSEKVVLRWHTTGEDFRPRLGDVGADLYDRLIIAEDPEIVVREMRATVEAGSARRPNKERDTDNINNMLPHIMPILNGHAETTGDTSPLNNMLNQWGEAVELDMNGLEMGPRVPQPPPPEVVQAEQAKVQTEMQIKQAELTAKLLDAEIKKIELQIKQVETQQQLQQGNFDAQGKQLEFLFDQAKGKQQLSQDEEEHAQDMQQKQREGLLEMLLKRQEGLVKEQQMIREGEIKIDLLETQAEIQARAARQKAVATPSGNGNGKP